MRCWWRRRWLGFLFKLKGTLFLYLGFYLWNPWTSSELWTHFEWVPFLDSPTRYLVLKICGRNDTEANIRHRFRHMLEWISAISQLIVEFQKGSALNTNLAPKTFIHARAGRSHSEKSVCFYKVYQSHHYQNHTATWDLSASQPLPLQIEIMSYGIWMGVCAELITFRHCLWSIATKPRACTQHTMSGVHFQKLCTCTCCKSSAQSCCRRFLVCRVVVHFAQILRK